jgi:hypothetical protein
MRRAAFAKLRSAADCGFDRYAITAPRLEQALSRLAFTVGAFERGLTFLLGVEHLAEGLAQFARQHHVAQPTMKDATKRSILRSIRTVFGKPIVGYIYSPFEELPNYSPVVRYVALPVIVLSGRWMWKGHVLRRLISKKST